jgi:fructose-1,6-bisphosphatase/inositol monophosphatase family enzyme
MGSALGFVERSGSPEAQALLELMGEWDYTFGFMDAYTYGSIAAGRIDVCVNLLDKPWDNAAAVCIVEQAGGRFSDLTGTPSIYNGATVLTNGRLHAAVLAHFRTAQG